MSNEQSAVRLQKRIPAPPARVYRAWIGPELIRRGMAPGEMQVTRRARRRSPPDLVAETRARMSAALRLSCSSWIRRNRSCSVGICWPAADRRHGV